MLGSITSLGERSRGRRWTITFAGFLLGALAGGVVLAAVLLGIRAAGSLFPAEPRLGVAAMAAFAIFGMAVFGREPPSLARQVDHRWLDTLRGFVVGCGFGFQLGAAGFTRIPSFAIYVVAVAAFAGASPTALVAAGVCYGAIRGIAALPGGSIRSPRDLQRLTAFLVRAERPTRIAALAIDLASAAAVIVAAALLL